MKIGKYFRTAILTICLLSLAVSCKKENKKTEYTPWGTVIEDGDSGDAEASDSSSSASTFSLADIENNGELIMLTLSGPSTYYDYKGVGLGKDYLLCEKFASSIGVSVRVELCKDTLDMINKLKKGKGDLIAYPLKKGKRNDIAYCGAYQTVKEKDSNQTAASVQWAVNKGNKSLEEALNHWFTPHILANVQKEEKKILSEGLIIHKVYAPMINAAGGVISKYDHLFKKYAPMARIDWRLMAAQCYTESGFDTYAKSWAGYCGLMAIMPGTAKELGIPVSSLTNPEVNISASATCMAKFERMFQDIGDPFERLKFRLAAYNAGPWHIRDAMALTRQHGRNPHRWDDVAESVLKLSDPTYYKLPIIKCGYMRGSETVNYVSKIMQRWSSYCGSARGGGVSTGNGLSPNFDHSIPQRATKKYKYHV